MKVITHLLLSFSHLHLQPWTKGFEEKGSSDSPEGYVKVIETSRPSRHWMSLRNETSPIRSQQRGSLLCPQPTVRGTGRRDMLLNSLVLLAVVVASCARSPWDRERRYEPRLQEKRVQIYTYPTEESQYMEDRFLRRGGLTYNQPYRRLPPADNNWRRSGDMWYQPSRGARIQVGRGRYRILGRSNAAELQCSFPEQDHRVISNIIWTRSDLTDTDLQSLSRQDTDQTGHYSAVTDAGQGSTLYLNHVTTLDLGSYRCMATARSAGSGLIHTVYQDIDFYPEL